MRCSGSVISVTECKRFGNWELQTNILLIKVNAHIYVSPHDLWGAKQSKVRCQFILSNQWPKNLCLIGQQSAEWVLRMALLRAAPCQPKWNVELAFSPKSNWGWFRQKLSNVSTPKLVLSNVRSRADLSKLHRVCEISSLLDPVLLLKSVSYDA